MTTKLHIQTYAISYCVYICGIGTYFFFSKYVHYVTRNEYYFTSTHTRARTLFYAGFMLLWLFQNCYPCTILYQFLIERAAENELTSCVTLHITYMCFIAKKSIKLCGEYRKPIFNRILRH